jgi:hypothetical protein
MTPKEVAKVLVNKYEYLVPSWDCYNDEPLEIEYKLPSMKECALLSIEFARQFITGDLTESFDKTMYLLEIKQEIEKL